LLIGGPQFISETVVAYELGFRSPIGSNVSISVSTFFNVYDHVRSTSASPPPAVLGLPLFYTNNLEGETYGIELNLAYQALSWWQLQFGYSLFREDIQVKEDKTDFNNALNETADPKNRLSLRSFMRIGSKLEFSSDFRWIDEFTFNNSGVPEQVPDYGELQLRLGWHVSKQFVFSIVGQNVLHQQHLEYVISSPNPRQEIQRSVYGKLVYQLK
jgi:iron complex outermembrane receptor protein